MPGDWSSSRPVFACASDVVGHGLLGYHDGVDRWSLNLASGLAGSVQSFVARHERAHDALHVTTAWGTAMIMAGLGASAATTTAWHWLGAHCLQAHEQFATYTSVEATPDGLDHLAGNFLYLNYYRAARAMVQRFDAEPLQRATVDVAYRLAMSPRWLLAQTATSLRSEPFDTGGLPTPDLVLEGFRSLFADAAFVLRWTECLRGSTTYGERWDRAAGLLDESGSLLIRWQEYEEWLPGVIDQNNALPGRGVVLVDRSTVDPLATLMDTMQHESLVLHDERLVFDWSSVPEVEERHKPAAFARSHHGFGPHVVLAWLHPDVLRKQFSGVPEAWDDARLGFFGSDRRPHPPVQLWCDFGDAPPSIIAQAVRSTRFSVLTFTTLRTLQESPTTIDFRGWDPTFILIDVPVVDFVQDNLAKGISIEYWITGTEGSRYLDHVVLQLDGESALNFVYSCSTLASRAMGNWLASLESVHVSPNLSYPHRDALAAFLEHLIGSFRVLELGRW